MVEKLYFELPTDKWDLKIPENSPLNYEVEVAVRKWKSNKAVVIIVWKWWSVDWYMNKYWEMTSRLSEKHWVNTFVVENPWISWDNPELFFDCAINFVTKKMNEFWFNDFDIDCIWFSAWWHFVWRFAYKYSNIKQMLLINPVLRVDFEKLKKALNSFNWKITIIQWNKDVDYVFNPLLKQIPKAHIVILDWVDHQFTLDCWLEMFIWLPEKYLYN